MLILMVLLGLVATLSGQPVVQALVSERKVVEGQTLTFEIRVEEGDLQGASLPPLRDFRVLSGPSTSRSVQYVNGQISSVTSNSWTLLPKRTGRLLIPSLSVTVNSKTYQTESIAVEVIKASEAAAAAGEQAPISLLVEVEPGPYYRGQQVTVTWRLQTTRSISSWEVMNLPAFTGFWTEDLFSPTKLQLKETVKAGRRIYTAVVRRTALFPTHSGRLELDPLVLKVGVQQPRRRRDPFFDDFSFFNPTRIESRIISSKTVRINVRPIPAAGRPAGFTGLVGDFTLTAQLDQQSVEQDDAVTLLVSMEGDGNIRALEAPQIEFPEGLEVFDPKIATEKALGDIVGGRRIFEYVMIPRESGAVEIPVIAISYFNPHKKTFQNSSAGPFTLTVAPRDGVRSGAAGFSRQEIALLGEDIRFVKAESPRWLKRDRVWYTPGIFFISAFAILLLAAPWASGRAEGWIKYLRPGIDRRRAFYLASSMIQNASGSASEYYASLTAAMTRYLNAKLAGHTSEYSIDEVLEILRARAIDEQTIANITQILERCAAARFAPEGGARDPVHGDQLLRALERLEVQWES